MIRSFACRDGEKLCWRIQVNDQTMMYWYTYHPVLGCFKPMQGSNFLLKNLTDPRVGPIHITEEFDYLTLPEGI